MQRPTIGVPTQTLQAIDGIPAGLPHSWVMNHRYFTALVASGAVPWMIPLMDSETDTLRAIYDRLDGLFIAGGVDLDPSSYGEEQHPLCGRTDLSRDRVELMMTKWALEDKKPVFGVCRGMQVINVAAGGTLYQDCTELYAGSIKHDYFPTAGFARDHLAHEVRLADESRLRQIFGSPVIRVNSMHHQGIRTLGEGLMSSAYAEDELIEALEGTTDHFLVGVQWHPEMLVDGDAGTRRLFDSFIEDAREWRESQAVVGV